jgi:hypothetical protein
MRVAIVGSRTFTDYARIRKYIEKIAAKYPDAVIVSGGAKGVDTLAERAANEVGLRVMIFPADWSRLGKRSGFVRNVTIVEESDVVVAFWDGESRGTKHTIDIARQSGVSVHVYR